MIEIKNRYKFESLMTIITFTMMAAAVIMMSYISLITKTNYPLLSAIVMVMVGYYGETLTHNDKMREFRRRELKIKDI